MYPTYSSPAATVSYSTTFVTPVRQPVRTPSSRVQAGTESVAAPLVRADALNVEVLTDLQPVNAGRDLPVLARLLDAWTDVGVP